MKSLNLLLVFAALLMLGCEEDDTKSSPKNTQVIESNERRGGNGNGNGQGGNTITDPCANYPTYPLVYEAATDWNIKVDTTICGMVNFRWDPQPGFNPVTDTCYTIARYYYIGFSPISAIGGCTGGGSISGTNSYYYTLGAGCSLWPGGKYIMGITYYERNVELQKTFVRSSKSIEFTAGTRAPWLNNCQ